MSSATLQNDRLLAALNAVDTLKRDRDEANSLLNSDEQDKQTEKVLREMLTLQGETVDETTIAQAVAISRAPKALALSTMTDGVGRSLASLYIRRDRWLAKVLGVLAALGLGGTVFWTGDAVLQARFEDQAQTTFTQIQELRGQLPQAQAKVAGLAGYPALQSQAQVALTRANSAQASLDAQLKGRVPEDKEALGQARGGQEELTQRLGEIDTLSARARTLDALKAQMAGFRQRGVRSAWPELAAAMRGQEEAFAQAIGSQDEKGAARAIEALSHMATADAGRQGLLAAAQSVPETAKAAAAPLLARGEAALLAGRPGEATQAQAELSQLKTMVATTYTMRIVNEQGVKSGVWRYSNDNPSGDRNYYVVVDSLDARGEPVEVPIRNEETGKTEQVSRFAVRVPESFYEQVKADKTDNGLIDNDLVGNKAAGQLDPTFAVPVAGGFITSW